MKLENNLEELDMSFNEWRKVKLEDVVIFNPTERLQKGVTAKKVAMECLTPFTRKVASYEITEFKGGTKFRNGDTLVARITPCLENGKTAFVDVLDNDEIGFGSTEYIVLREKHTITDKKFIYYLSISPQFRDIAIKSMNGSSGRQRVQNDVLKSTDILLPPLNEQKAIADILSSLDDKIELNKQMNETLEEMAQALFKRWFVDFEFPNEEGQPYKSSGGEMVESELGMIPKGWEVKGLGELINISSGKRPSKKSSEKDKEYRYPLIGASSVMGYVLEPLCEDKILVIGRVGTHGVVQRFCGPVWPSDNTLVIRTAYYEFINQILQKIDYSSINRGSTQPLITQTDIKNTKIIVPDKSLLKVYEEKCESLFNLIEHNEVEKVYLGSLRDTLLPKLMSGEIRVSDLKG